MEAKLFEGLIIILGFSLLTTIALRRLRFPSIVAYLLAGCLIGPHVFNWIQTPEHFTFLAEFGVVFLLFSLGLEFSLPKLIALRRSVFGVGGVQVAVCTLVFGGAVKLWGTTWEAAIVIAGALALSSTAIVTRELSTLHQVHQRHGQLAIGVLLFQDLVAIFFLVLVPVLGGVGTSSLASEIGWALTKALLLLVVFLSVGKWV
ncbi:MAG: cation:proton antiporter, partial [Pseudomonadota bacterium]